MAASRAAYRYARAFLDVVEEHRKVDAVVTDFELIGKLIKDSRDFLLFLQSPVVNKERKKSVLRNLLGERIDVVTLKFILLLTTKNRENILPDIIEQFYVLRDELLGIVNATVYTATSFTKEQEKQLIDRLEQKTKKKIRLRYLVEPALKGGFRVQIGDTVWDGSVARQLELLRDWFGEESYP